MSQLPKFYEMMNPLLQALEALGGSGTIEELDGKVAEIMNLSDEQLEVLHNPQKGGQTKISYRLAWTRTYLKKYGLLENSGKGVWALTQNGQKLKSVNAKEIVRFVRDEDKKIRGQSADVDDDPIDLDDEVQPTWREELLATLMAMDPSAFERLIQRLLRESGFIQVEVTGKSGDGGVDGKGIMRLGGLLSFHVIFQCKRYSGSVGAGHVRDFRGAMVGRADKGLLITTGNFTRDAEREATRDGAPAIDLIDGNLLLDKLKELGLGLDIQMVQVEQVKIKRDWFLNL